MTTRAENLERQIRDAYEAEAPDRADWADWLYENHVFLVADEAERLANQLGEDAELARAAAALHDVADAKMSRFAPGHEEKSMQMAREMLRLAGFDGDEIAVVVYDAIRLHGCHGGVAPETMTGKILSTADAVVHLSSDFYEFARKRMEQEDGSDFAAWAASKIDRDFNEKIQFQEVQDRVREDYEALLTRLN